MILLCYCCLIRRNGQLPTFFNAMQQDKEQTVKLKIPIDVVLTYLTAWTDGKDRIQFRKDIYLRDEMVLEALNQ